MLRGFGRSRFQTARLIACAAVIAFGLTSATRATSTSMTASAADPAPPKLDLMGPHELVEGERAFFFSSTQPRVALRLRSERTDGSEPLALEVGARWPVGRTGDFRVILENDSWSATPLAVRVRALPPVVAATEPLARRRACVQVFVWDGGRSQRGLVLEELGRIVGPDRVGDSYATKWILAGRQATRANVSDALRELAARGYTIDLFTSVHGYPIELADGAWTDLAHEKGLRSVRLHYTTACNGGDGAQAFLDAGVRTYVAAKGTNFVSDFHAARFLESWTRGRTVTQSSERAFNSIHKLVLEPGIGDALRALAKTFDPGEVPGTRAEIEAALEASRPLVHGDAELTIETERVAKERVWR